MKFWFGTPGWGWRLWGVSNGDKWFIGLSIKQQVQMAVPSDPRAAAEKAIVETLRREREELRYERHPAR